MQASNTPSASGQPRQQPGLACEECRARKLRCDRGRPCSSCRDLGVDCTVNTARKPRGPARGLMRTLQTRIATIEQRMDLENKSCDELYSDPIKENARKRRKPSAETSSNHFDLASQSLSLAMSGTLDPVMFPHEASEDNQTVSMLPQDAFTSSGPVWLPSPPSDLSFDLGEFNEWATQHNHLTHLSQEELGDVSDATASSGHRSVRSMGSSVGSASVRPDLLTLTELVRADLTQLYFDRIHEFVPMIHQCRFFASASTRKTTHHFDCLQHSMWTLASSMASQFQDIRTALYLKTKDMLEQCGNHMSSDSQTSIELTQAWALIALYEICQMDFQRGWLSAGRCFRFVQLHKMHEVDKAQFQIAKTSWIVTEERRRTFWVAYVLDRIINLKAKLPLTFQEHDITTRLPAPELSFIQNQATQTLLLNESINEEDPDKMTPFTKLIVALTISTFLFSKQQQSSASTPFGPEDDYNMRQIDGTDGLYQMKLLQCSVQPSFSDPLATFAVLLSQTTILHLWPSLHGQSDKPLAVIIEKLETTLQTLSARSYFKIHPLTPIPLMIGAVAMHAMGVAMPALHRGRLDKTLSLLGKLSPGSSLARTCMKELNGTPMDML